MARDTFVGVARPLADNDRMPASYWQWRNMSTATSDHDPTVLHWKDDDERRKKSKGLFGYKLMQKIMMTSHSWYLRTRAGRRTHSLHGLWCKTLTMTLANHGFGSGASMGL